MARVQLFLCFTILFASVALLDVVSAHLKLKPSLPQIEDPQTVNDVEPYTVKVVMVFVADLEKECPKTNKFKAFFEKLRGFAKYVCPIRRSGQADYDRDMKAKAGGIFKAISSFAIGKIREEIQEEKMEAINTFRFMKSVAAKIMGGLRKGESEDTMKLTAEQQKEIKEGILKWETIITRITNTMVMSSSNSSSSEESSVGKEESSSSSNNNSENAKTEKGVGSSDKTKSTGGGSSSFNKGGYYEDTTGSNTNMGSPSGSPSSSPSSSPSGSSSFGASGSTTSSKDTTSKDTTTKDATTKDATTKDTTSKDTTTKDATTKDATAKDATTKDTTSKDTTGGSSNTSIQNGSSNSENVEASQSSSSGVTVTQLEAETSKDISSFIMNLEKKCPQKEEFKAFFEQLKGTMIAPPKERKGLFTRIKSAAGKISGAMAFMRSRIGSKSAEVKKSMETYQEQVMKTLQELETIHGQIVIQNKGKTEGTLTCTPAQQTQIKQTITKWEQVTTQFVETAVQSESSQSSSTSSSSSSSSGKLQAN